MNHFIKCSLKPLISFSFKSETELISRFLQIMCAVVSLIKAYSVASVFTRALTVFLLTLLNKI